MIRSRRIDATWLSGWLRSVPITGGTAQYRLRVWRADSQAFPPPHASLIAYLEEAFEDAKARVRRGFQDDLSPFIGAPVDPAYNYPRVLHDVTLQGYLGEILGVVAIEHWGAHGYSDWTVPAFLFRFHDVEFQHLDVINDRLQRGELHHRNATGEMRPGRTGDDGIAFRVDEQNNITHVVVVEAKCVTRNNAQTVDEAYEKLSSSAFPTAVRELVNLLADYNTLDANRWREALFKCFRTRAASAQRFDVVAYACGHFPQQRNRTSWMDGTVVNATYTGGRNVEALEFQFDSLPPVLAGLWP